MAWFVGCVGVEADFVPDPVRAVDVRRAVGGVG